MPELPEVETIRLQLSSKLIGLKIKSFDARSKKIFSDEPKLVTGKTVRKLRRYSKVLVIDLTDGVSLVIHLKMTGRLVYEKFKNRPVKVKAWDIDYPKDKHTHVIIGFTNGDKLYFNDVRKFGWIRVVPTDEVEKLPYIAKLGPEFFRNLSEPEFTAVIKAGTRPVKSVLMDQEKLAGIGNIYANESLWCAKINPKIKAKELSKQRIVNLFNCLEKIMRQAIKWRGASDNNYRDAYGEKGQVQEHFNVYNRLGYPCPRCQTPVKKFTLGGRGTYYCPKCQAA